MFLHPAFLWGLLAAALPVLIHFLRKTPVKVLDFSTLRFLPPQSVTASRMKALKKFLIMAVRIGIIVTLVLLCSQPFNASKPFMNLKNASNAWYCWVDPSMSMEYRSSGRSLARNGYACVQALDSILPAATGVYLWDEAGRQFINGRGSPALSTREAYGCRYGTVDFSTVYRMFLDQKRTTGSAPVMVVLSDFQSKDSTRYLQPLRKKITGFFVILVALGEKHPWNTALVRPAGDDSMGSMVSCSTIVYGKGADTAVIYAEVNGMRNREYTVSFGKNTPAVTHFDLVPAGSEATGTLRLQYTDPYEHDNTLLFHKKYRSDHRCIIIGDTGRNRPLYFAFRALGYARVTQKNESAFTIADSDSADIICIGNCAKTTPLLSMLWDRGIVSRKLILFAPSTAQTVDPVAAALFSRLLPGTPVHPVHDAVPRSPRLPDTLSLLWHGFKTILERSVRIHDYLTPMPGEAILGLENGAALITHCIDGSNNAWILFSSPVGIPAANNLPETGFFIPLLDRCIRYAKASQTAAAEPWLAGVPHANPFPLRNAFTRVFDEGHKEVAVWRQERSVSINHPGIYRLVTGTVPDLTVAVQPDPSEGQCVYTVPPVPPENKDKVLVLDRDSFTSFLNDKETISTQRILWILLCLLLLGEILLWRREGKRADSG